MGAVLGPPLDLTTCTTFHGQAYAGSACAGRPDVRSRPVALLGQLQVRRATQALDYRSGCRGRVDHEWRPGSVDVREVTQLGYGYVLKPVRDLLGEACVQDIARSDTERVIASPPRSRDVAPHDRLHAGRDPPGPRVRYHRRLDRDQRRGQRQARS
jgi:hypothetical protein